MAVTRTTNRELITCDGCGILARQWRHVVIVIDGETVRDVRVCFACEISASGALDTLWRH